jgi:hypothetical protein
MRHLLKTLGTLVILVSLVGGGFYAYRAGEARAAGREYSLSEMPGDMAQEIRGLFEPVVKPVEERAADRKDEPDDRDEPSEPTKKDDTDVVPEDRGAPPQDPLVTANAHYLAGRYADAEPLLKQVLATSGATGTRPAELMARVKLFRILLAGVRPGSDLEGSAVALITMPGGRRMLVQVLDEGPDDLEFLAPRGIKSRMKIAEFKDLTVARSRDERLALLEREYRLRHETTRTSGEFLALARYSCESGLTSHITYCLERSLTAPGTEVQELLAKEYGAAVDAGDYRRKELAADLFKRFFPRAAIAADTFEPGDRPGIEIGKGPSDPDTDTAGTGGIGGVRERKISRLGKRDPKLAALFKEAEKHRKEGDKYYKKAFGGKGSSDDRDKALAAYRKAQELYEKAEEQWGVALESTFKDIQTRVYDLIKSGR